MSTPFQSREATVVINGTLMEGRHSMTLRVALNHYAGWLKEHGLGDDEHGKTMTEGYLRAIRELLQRLS